MNSHSMKPSTVGTQDFAADAATVLERYYKNFVILLPTEDGNQCAIYANLGTPQQARSAHTAMSQLAYQSFNDDDDVYGLA